jgi:hypothetical protein
VTKNYSSKYNWFWLNRGEYFLNFLYGKFAIFLILVIKTIKQQHLLENIFNTVF